jgi:hypothetical protein
MIDEWTGIYMYSTPQHLSVKSKMQGYFMHSVHKIEDVNVAQACLMSQLWNNVVNMHELLTACSDKI